MESLGGSGYIDWHVIQVPDIVVNRPCKTLLDMLCARTVQQISGIPIVRLCEWETLKPKSGNAFVCNGSFNAITRNLLKFAMTVVDGLRKDRCGTDSS